MIFLDTGYLIALAHANDDLHERAVNWSNALREPALLTDYILLEMVNRLSSPINRPKAHALLAHIQGGKEYEVVLVDARIWNEGINSHRTRRDKEWSLTDCISFVIMRERGITRALAYDHHFEQAGFEALLRRDPS